MSETRETREPVAADLQQVRCVYWLDNGQQVKCWLPAGAYHVDGIEQITMSDRGATLKSESVRLVAWNNGVTYWIHPDSLQVLRESTVVEQI